MKEKYIIYCRKSTESEDRQILSLPAQKRELTEYAKKNGLKVVRTLVESASAYKLGRPKFNEMLQLLQDDKANCVLVWAYNRLARNALDGGMIVHLLDQGIIKEIKTPTGSTNGAGNSKFMLQLEFAMSKKSSDDNSESVKRGNKEKILRGWDIRSHTGYMFTEDEQTGEKVLVPDPERFDLIKRAFQEVLKGKPVVRTLDKLNHDWGYRSPKTRRQGGKRMSKSHFYKILHEEFYCGWLYTQDGERIPGKHPPMISEAEFWEVQTILGRRGKPRPKWLSLPYRGLIKCGECGCSVCMEEKHQCICSNCKKKFSSKNRDHCPKCNKPINRMLDPTHIHYIYGRCTKKKKDVDCSQKTIRLEELEKTLHEYLASLSLSPRVVGWVLQQLAVKHQEQFKTKDQIRKNLKGNLETTQRQLDALLASFTAPENADYGLITTNEYKLRKENLQEEKIRIKQKLDDSLGQSDSWMDSAEKVFNFANTAKEKFEKGDYKTKTDIIQHLGLNLTLKDRKITIDQPHPWLFMYEANQKLAELENKGLEPEKSTDDYDKLGVKNEVISTLQAH